MPKCDSGFPALVPNGFANFNAICVKCPYGCTACIPADITKPYDGITCSACDSNSYLNSANLCRPNYEKNKPTCKTN